MTSSVTANEVSITAGLDVTASLALWNVDPVIRSNLSVLIDENYHGPFVLTAERDIIIDAPVFTDDIVDFKAENIIFTDKGALGNPLGTIALHAGSEVQFSQFSSDGIQAALLGKDVRIQAARIVGAEHRTISADTLSAIAESGFGLRTNVRHLEARVLGDGDLEINALGSIELGGVDVLDGTLSVVSSGNILARDVNVRTDRYANQLLLKAAGGIAVDQVVVGQSMGVWLERGTSLSNIDNALGVLPVALDETMREGDPATFQVEIRDLSGILPAGSADFEVQVDFGDGTPVRTIVVPYVEPQLPTYGKPSLVIDGGFADSWLGGAIAAAGDINGDGYADMVVGQGAADRILIFLGGKGGFSETPNAVIEGPQAGSGFGDRVASVGDIDGDGFDDIIVTAPDRTTASQISIVQTDGTIVKETGTLFGQVLVYQGTETGLASKASWTLEGFEKAGGIIVAGAGDVDNDGYGDILVAEPQADVSIVIDGELVTLADGGTVRLFTGSAHGLSGEPAWTYLGQEAGGLFGSAVSSAGDVDGDGFDDIMIGAYLEDGGGLIDSGRCYFFQGSENGISSVPMMVLEGGQEGDWFGASIAAVGDVNNDGFDDVLLGAPGHTGGDGGSGVAYLYSGTLDGLDANPLTINAQTGYKRFGREVSGAGDVNGDGYHDVLVQGVTQNGDVQEVRTVLYLGAQEGLPNEMIALGERVVLSAGFGDPGGSMAGLGDIDGDGFDDMAVGVWTKVGKNLGGILIYDGRVVDLDPPMVGSAQFSHIYQDDGDYIISVTVAGTATRDLGALRIPVDNASPVLGPLHIESVGGDENGSVAVNGVFTDEGFADTHTGRVEWGDGTTSDVMIDEENGTGTFTASHTYLNAGIYDVSVTLSDDDGGSAVQTGTAMIAGTRVHDGVLEIVGTAGADNVTVRRSGADDEWIEVRAGFLSEDNHTRAYAADSIERIVVMAGDGNDSVKIDHEIVNPVTMDGGDGDDHLFAGGGPAVLIGGPGDDRIFGSPASDTIHGGDGNDTLFGNGGDDIINGGMGDDRVFGSTGGDILSGADGNDVVFGGEGDDILYIGAENDRLLGGQGENEFKEGDMPVPAQYLLSDGGILESGQAFNLMDADGDSRSPQQVGEIDSNQVGTESWVTTTVTMAAATAAGDDFRLGDDEDFSPDSYRGVDFVREAPGADTVDAKAGGDQLPGSGRSSGNDVVEAEQDDNTAATNDRSRVSSAVTPPATGETENQSPMIVFEMNERDFDDHSLKLKVTPEADAANLFSGLEDGNLWLSDFLTNCGEGLEDPNAKIALVLTEPMNSQAVQTEFRNSGNHRKAVNKKK
ncbi:MAG: FG-GAP-like repeat-containing protein [Desulfobacteraceae bacterium]|nr:FG-GAP-like repeat-containing protein [Desulfobacteraceae bacterium]